MADARFFAKLDVGYFDNPKVGEFLEDRPRVMILHLRAIVYCRQHLTDGAFPVRQVARLACATYCGGQCQGQCDFCAAVNAGLFVAIDERTAEVHDYLKHQDSAEQVTRRREAGQAAAERRWNAKGNAKGTSDGNATGNAAPNAEERRGEERTSSTRKRGKHAIPEDWKPNAKHQDYAEDNGLDLSTESFRFRNHAHANDRRQVDWDAAFRMWLSKAKDYAPAKPSQAKMKLPEAWR